MIKIREIEKAVLNLPRRDFKKFRQWFHKFDALRWDQQLKADVKNGKLDAFAQKALNDFENGKCKEL